MAPTAFHPMAFLSGLLAEPLASAVGILVGFTTLMGGAAHYGSILTGQSKHTVEYYTGMGFFSGMIIGTVVAFFALLP
jgi:hypothetical protein